METKTKSAPADSSKASASVKQTSAPVKQVTLKLGKQPRIAGHTATKNGKGGTAGTWDAIAAHMAANKGTITLADLQRICTENGDTGFARYAMGRQRNWLVPVEDKKS